MDLNTITQELQKRFAAPLDRSLSTLAARILLTAGSRTLPEAALSGLDRFISVSSQHQAYYADLVSDWIHSDDIIMAFGIRSGHESD